MDREWWTVPTELPDRDWRRGILRRSPGDRPTSLSLHVTHTEQQALFHLSSIHISCPLLAIVQAFLRDSLVLSSLLNDDDSCWSCSILYESRPANPLYNE